MARPRPRSRMGAVVIRIYLAVALLALRLRLDARREVRTTTEYVGRHWAPGAA